MKASDGIGTLRSQLSPLVPLGEVKLLNFVPRTLTIDLILFGLGFCLPRVHKRTWAVGGVLYFKIRSIFVPQANLEWWS